ncbi:MAG: hypothetical protein ACOWWR_18110 [Eubacteriales bacterium]
MSKIFFRLEFGFEKNNYRGLDEMNEKIKDTCLPIRRRLRKWNLTMRKTLMDQKKRSENVTMLFVILNSSKIVTYE